MEKFENQKLWEVTDGIQHRIDELGRCVIKYGGKEFVFAKNPNNNSVLLAYREHAYVSQVDFDKMVAIATKVLKRASEREDDDLALTEALRKEAGAENAYERDAETHKNNLLKDVEDP